MKERRTKINLYFLSTKLDMVGVNHCLNPCELDKLSKNGKYFQYSQIYINYIKFLQLQENIRCELRVYDQLS